MRQKNLPQKLFILFAFLFCGKGLFAQSEQLVCPKMLLNDLSIQIESTEAINQMYNFKFNQAEAKFKDLKKRYPQHPMPYFLLGLSNWWKMLPNTDIHTFDDAFLAYMDSSILFGEQLFDANNNNLEAAFFLAASYGLKGEFYGTRKSYTKAAWATKNALRYFKVTSDNSSLSPEFLYGKGILNYYRPWLKEKYPLLFPFLMLFPSGDEELGIKQLKEVSYKAFYSRTEAQYQLLRIYDNEDEYQKAYPIAKYLVKTFPDNSYFSRQYAKFAWFLNKYPEAKQECKSIIYKLDNGYPGFEATAGRYAGYILGDIYRKENKQDSAQKYFEKAVIYSERAGYTDQGYYFYALDGLAEIAEESGNNKAALQYYKTLLHNGRKKRKRYEIVKDAKDKIKEIRKRDSD